MKLVFSYCIFGLAGPEPVAHFFLLVEWGQNFPMHKDDGNIRLQATAALQS